MVATALEWDLASSRMKAFARQVCILGYNFTLVHIMLSKQNDHGNSCCADLRQSVNSVYSLCTT